MTHRDFAYWLRGYTEITDGQIPTAAQWEVIKDHVREVAFEAFIDKVRAAGVTGSIDITDWDLQTGRGVTIGAPSTSQVTPTGAQIVRLSYPTLPYSGHPPITGFSILSGSEAFGGEEWLARENAGKVFITISPVPSWDPKATYSWYPNDHGSGPYPTYDPLTRDLITGLGINTVGDKVYVTVDNALKPRRETYAYRMQGSSTHLTQPGERFGIINVGIGSPLIC